jgi:hypothetical protein
MYGNTLVSKSLSGLHMVIRDEKVASFQIQIEGKL